MSNNCCSLVHHISGVCNTCPNNEECNLKIILAMQKTIDTPINQEQYWEEQGPLNIGEAID